MVNNKTQKADFWVLFVYYNPRKMSLIPPSIAIFSRLLKSMGVEVALFDTTLYEKHEDCDVEVIDEKNLVSKPFSDNLNKYRDKIVYKTTDVYSDLGKIVNEFKPDLLAVTAVESTFEGSIRLLKSIHRHKIPTIMGGVFATFAPHIAIARPEVDMICIGEGERALVELVDKMRKGEDYSHVSNLWVKDPDGTLTKSCENTLKRLAGDHGKVLFIRPVSAKV